jgi:hypothetical protein
VLPRIDHSDNFHISSAASAYSGQPRPLLFAELWDALSFPPAIQTVWTDTVVIRERLT